MFCFVLSCFVKLKKDSVRVSYKKQVIELFYKSGTKTIILYMCVCVCVHVCECPFVRKTRTDNNEDNNY